jgi:type IX secretion system PorP/SprF family membrane protein
MKKKFLLIYLCLVLGYVSYSQQDPQVSHNMFNNMFINPAFAGSNDNICFTGIVRQQWYGIKEHVNDKTYSVAPQTFLGSIDAPVLILHGGLGASIYQDQLGHEKTVGLKLNYAYRINVGSGMLSLGAQVSFLNKTLDFGALNPLDKTDPLLNDQAKENNFMTDYGFGLFYKVPGKMFVGLSATQLAQTKQAIGTADIALKRHYYLVSGYEYVLPNNPEFEIDPSVLVKTDGASAQYDLNGLVRYNNKFWGGVTYRVQDAVAVLLGMNIKNFRIGYSYDITTSKLTQAGSGGSHEVMLGYCFKIVIEKPRKSYRNTRFL